MNERIKELAVQAGLEMCSCGCDMPTRQSVKFAELIIQECIRLGEDSQYKCRTFPVSVAIKDHFGVV